MEKKKEFSSAGPACERRFLCFASKYGHRPDTFYVPSLAPTDPSAAAARQEWDSDGKQSWWLLTGPLTIYLLHQIPAQRRRWTSRAIPDRNTGEKKQQHTPGIQSPFSLPEWSFAYRQVAGKRKKVEERKMMKNWTGRYRADKKTTPRHANWIIIRLFSSPTAKRSVQTNQVTRRCGSHAVPADGKKKHKKCAHIYRKDVFTLDAG